MKKVIYGLLIATISLFTVSQEARGAPTDYAVSIEELSPIYNFEFSPVMVAFDAPMMECVAFYNVFEACKEQDITTNVTDAYSVISVTDYGNYVKGDSFNYSYTDKNTGSDPLLFELSYYFYASRIRG
jgi:hypothetical protein